MQYRCEATSVEGFVQQIACCYLGHGYWWYVTGKIPRHKSPHAVDQKLIHRYELGLSKRMRARRKQLGLANVHYLRHEHFFVLLATAGRHRLFEDEKSRVRDFRKSPLQFRGYSISYRSGGRTPSGETDRKWHAHVQIMTEAYKVERAYFLDLALRRSVDSLANEFRRVPFEPYAPIRRQLLNILRAMNKRRLQGRLEAVPATVLRLRRRIVRPFLRQDLAPPAATSSCLAQSLAQEVEVVTGKRASRHGKPDQSHVIGRDDDPSLVKKLT